MTEENHQSLVVFYSLESHRPIVSPWFGYALSFAGEVVDLN